MDEATVGRGTPLATFLEYSWAPVLGSGLTSALLVSLEGSVLSLLDLEQPPEMHTVLAPENFTSIAHWTTPRGRTGLSITRSGEVYLFSRGQLLFARRNSRWQGFPLQLLLQRGWFAVGTKKKLDRPLKRAVLASLLDASAAHHGACVGIIARDAEPSLAISDLVGQRDDWRRKTAKRRMFGDTDLFTDLSRRRRLELLSMDGATLINQSGEIITAGAILRVPSGSSSGGRLAAARQISRYGVGIKVSQDGPIRAFVRQDGQTVQHFSMG
jgi:hypothetical protein